MFLGYCFNRDGKYGQPVFLDTPQEAFDYVMLQKDRFPEVKVTDLDDYIVLHAKDGKIVFPKPNNR